MSGEVALLICFVCLFVSLFCFLFFFCILFGSLPFVPPPPPPKVSFVYFLVSPCVSP